MHLNNTSRKAKSWKISKEHPNIPTSQHLNQCCIESTRFESIWKNTSIQGTHQQVIVFSQSVATVDHPNHNWRGTKTGKSRPVEASQLWTRNWFVFYLKETAYYLSSKFSKVSREYLIFVKQHPNSKGIREIGFKSKLQPSPRTLKENPIDCICSIA